MRFFSKLFNRSMSSLLSVCLIATSVPFSATMAHAAPACADAYTVDAGQDGHCAARRIGVQIVTYPKLEWAIVTGMPLAQKVGLSRAPAGDEAGILANRSAAALGLSAADVASAVSLFPANVPYVFARYNPLDSTLRIDIFKLEKTLANGGQQAGLYQATFTPAHGDFWKASRSYITPQAFKDGTIPGVNPFETFKSGTSDLFHNISTGGAQVAIGHAMRYAGAPVAVMAIADTRLSQETQRSGNWLRKKVTTIITGHAKSKWLIAQPSQFSSRSTALAIAAYCAPDPQRENCARYETASAGVTFEEFEGGTLSADEDSWELDRQSKSGFGFLAILALAVIGSFAIAGVLAEAGLAGAAASGGAAATASSASAGMFGQMLVSQGLIGGFTSTAAAIAVEAGYIAASLAVVTGANLSSMMTLSPAVLLGYSSVLKGTATAPELTGVQARLNNQVGPRMSGNVASAPMLSGFSKTVIGNCAPGAKLTDCAGSTGFIQHVDQFIEYDLGTMMRDNNGQVVRDATPRVQDMNP